MRKTLSKKAVLAAAIAVVAIAITAGAAFAAPVLQPGVTSAPGMSGTCTNCHTYAQPAAKAAPKPVAVSHPYVAKGKHRPGRTLKVWGYIAPRVPKTSETTLTIVVQKRIGRSWVTTDSLGATGTVTIKGKFKGKKDNYAAKLKLPAGLYRLRAKLVYLDAKGVEKTRTSKFLAVKVHK